MKVNFAGANECSFTIVILYYCVDRRSDRIKAAVRRRVYQRGTRWYLSDAPHVRGGGFFMFATSREKR